MFLHDLNLVSHQKSRKSHGYPYQTQKTFHRSLFAEAIHLVIGQLKVKILGQSEKDMRARLQGRQQTRRRSVGHELGDIQKHFPIRRLLAAMI
jgi:hypothetical protein